MIAFLKIVRILIFALCVYMVILGCFIRFSGVTGQLVENEPEEIETARIWCTVHRWINAVHGPWHYTSQNDTLIIRSPKLRIERENETLQINKGQVLKPGESLQYISYFIPRLWNIAEITLENEGLVDDTLLVKCLYYEHFSLFKGAPILLICLIFILLIGRQIKAHNRTIQLT
jgi:hypothetical protein